MRVIKANKSVRLYCIARAKRPVVGGLRLRIRLLLTGEAARDSGDHRLAGSGYCETSSPELGQQRLKRERESESTCANGRQVPDYLRELYICSRVQAGVTDHDRHPTGAP